MTQAFNNIEPTDIVGESLTPLKDRDQAAKTSFMGTSLPDVTESDVGMACIIIKTENGVSYKQIWRLVGYQDNQPSWQLERDLTRGLVYSTTQADVDVGSYQDKNVLLTSLAGQTAGSGSDNTDKLPYLSSKNTFSLTGITSFARQLLNAAAATTVRSLLGLGSLATKSSITSSDIAQNSIPINRLETGTYNHVITYAANGQPTTKLMPSGVPVGSIMIYPSSVLPDNTWIFLYGQQLQISSYPELWSFASSSNNIVSNYTDWNTNRKGSFYQESSTIFRVPDLRNYFVRAWDGPTGPTRTLGNVQGDASRRIADYFYFADTFYGSNFIISSDNGLITYTGEKVSVAERPRPDNDGKTKSKQKFLFDSSQVVPTANENRPANIALPYIMKAKP